MEGETFFFSSMKQQKLKLFYYYNKYRLKNSIIKRNIYIINWLGWLPGANYRASWQPCMRSSPSGYTAEMPTDYAVALCWCNELRTGQWTKEYYIKNNDTICLTFKRLVLRRKETCWRLRYNGNPRWSKKVLWFVDWLCCTLNLFCLWFFICCFCYSWITSENVSRVSQLPEILTSL